VLQAATSGGAGALGQPAGTVSAGAPADLSIFDTSGTEYCTEEDLLASLVLSSSSHRARTVLVDGDVIVDDGRITTVDEEALLEEARSMHQHLRQRNARYAAIADAQRKVLTRVSMAAPPNRDVVAFSSGAVGRC
jgi:cytosine/adenosine deaminase-related metal-dependent hydrolase